MAPIVSYVEYTPCRIAYLTTAVIPATDKLTTAGNSDPAFPAFKSLKKIGDRLLLGFLNRLQNSYSNSTTALTSADHSTPTGNSEYVTPGKISVKVIGDFQNFQGSLQLHLLIRYRGSSRRCGYQLQRGR